MKALVYYGPKNVKIEEIPQPKINDDEILIKTRACSICATDVKTILYGHKLIKPPAVLGHEIAGEIIRKGRNIKELEIGDRVAVAPYAPCGACYYCRIGREILCERLFEEVLVPGGFAEYIKVPRRLVEKVTIKLAESVSFEEASLLEPLACVLKSIQMVGVSPETTALVVGSGPMGLMHIMTLKKVYGVSMVISSDLLRERLNIAKRLGADYVVNATEEDVPQRVLELTEGRGVDVVFVDVPSFEAVKQALSSVKRGGTVCLFAGLPPGKEKYELNLNRIHYDEVLLCGSFGFTPKQYYGAYFIVRKKLINLMQIISHRIRLEEVPKIIEDIARHKTLKVTVVF